MAPNTLRAAVEALLDRQGKSLAQWARDLGISKQRLDQILNGDSVPSLPLALRMSESSGIRVEQFALGEDRRHAQPPEARAS